MDEGGKEKADVKVPEGEVGVKVREAFDSGKDTSKYQKDVIRDCKLT